eukprot:15294513-Heterocapsa_arctica.AAC.1
MLAYGDTTVNRGLQQLFLQPRMVENATPRPREAALFGGGDAQEDTHRLIVLRGWDFEEKPEA